jgi:hypothetical protein
MDGKGGWERWMERVDGKGGWDGTDVDGVDAAAEGQKVKRNEEESNTSCLTFTKEQHPARITSPLVKPEYGSNTNATIKRTRHNLPIYCTPKVYRRTTGKTPDAVGGNLDRQVPLAYFGTKIPSRKVSHLRTKNTLANKNKKGVFAKCIICFFAGLKKSCLF